jgi:hypothetical protein
MVQPLSDVTVVRPWHWGIAMVVDPECEAPDVRPEQVVTVDESGLVVLVRHAQDLEADPLGDDWEWATATIHVRALANAEPTPRPVLCDAVLTTPSQQLGIGDADGGLVLPTLGGSYSHRRISGER